MLILAVKMYLIIFPRIVVEEDVVVVEDVVEDDVSTTSSFLVHFVEHVWEICVAV